MKLLNNVVRIERKWSLHNANRAQFHIAISRNKLCFHKEYNSRHVNSIYFDDSHFNSLYENIDGNEKKAKYRVRWYGDKDKIYLPKFEIKIKQGILSSKKIYDLDLNNLDFNIFNIKKITEKINKILKLRKKIFPVLTTHYFRDYFISANKKIRATVDDNLQSIMLLNLGNFENKKNFKRLVLEVKYDATYDSFVRKILIQLQI